MYYKLNIRIKTCTGYHVPGEIVDLKAEGCNFDAIRRWEAEGATTKVAEPVVTHTQEPVQVQPVVPVTAPKGVPPSVAVWNLDAEALKDKSLAALNVMIAERDPDKEPFETEEEAIAQLTMESA